MTLATYVKIYVIYHIFTKKLKANYKLLICGFEIQIAPTMESGLAIVTYQ